MPDWNTPRWRPGCGGYESWFVRANHPAEPRALWLRYTIFAPTADPAAAVGERWAIAFDRDRIIAVYDRHPMSACSFDDRGVEIRGSTLTSDRAVGECASDGHALAWALGWTGDAPPALLLPASAYDRSFPRANAVSLRPDARLTGRLTVDGEAWTIDGWPGTTNHNWGSRHTDRYAWGQVVFGDGATLECASARVKVGPVWTPTLSFATLRVDGADVLRPGWGAALRARARYGLDGDRLRWELRTGGVTIRLEAPAARFARLTYPNPPGGALTCWNSKLAAAKVTLPDGRTLRSAHGAAFEILGDRLPLL